MIQALELLHLAKRHISKQTTLISEEINPITIITIELHLSEGISKSLNKSVENSLK